MFTFLSWIERSFDTMALEVISHVSREFRDMSLEFQAQLFGQLIARQLDHWREQRTTAHICYYAKNRAVLEATGFSIN